MDQHAHAAVRHFTVLVGLAALLAGCGGCPGAFTPTARLATARGCATATLLQDGKVLVAGGADLAGPLASAELFDPAGGGSFSPTGSLVVARGCPTATLLADGRVLVAGGRGPGGAVQASAELFDPATGAFTPTGALRHARTFATATPLADGTVLIAGGYGANADGGPDQALASAELYEPPGDGGAGSFRELDAMGAPRYQTTAVLLPDGRVLFVGGLPERAPTAELFDPAGDGGAPTFTPTASPRASRFDATATLLQSGQVLVAGGAQGSATRLKSAELFTLDGGRAEFSPTGPLETARRHATATLLPNGKVLVAGGLGETVLSSAELFDPAGGDAGLGAFSSAGNLAEARQGATATLLANGAVLIVGGLGSVDGGVSVTLSSAELYTPE